MLIYTAEGYRQMSVTPDPLPGCATHAVAGVRFSEVLGRFLRNDDSRFLDRHWQDAKDAASKGMVE